MAANEAVLPVLSSFKESVNTFIANMKKSSAGKNVPKWFHDFCEHLELFNNNFISTVMKLEKNQCELESKLAVQKAVSDGLVKDRVKLQEKIVELEVELDDLNNYTRRTNLLIHGLEEENGENTDTKVLGVFNTQLGLTIPLKDVGRTHRLGRKVQGRKRPIIVRFATYRQRKAVFDSKSKLNGSATVFTENLTKTGTTYKKKES